MFLRDARKITLSDYMNKQNDIDIFSDEAFVNFLDNQSSERRFDELKDQELAMKLILSAAKELERCHGLTVHVATTSDNLPAAVHQDACFKYSLLGECKKRMSEGQDLRVSVVCEDGMVIGYGLANRQSTSTFDIEIIDVEAQSRRLSGLKQNLTIAGEDFTVGIGHILVAALIETTSATLLADATHDSSRYVFKSLGFKSYAENPCLLRFDGRYDSPNA